MSSVFRFKQFEVDQRDCAMKINTDGVLLGAIVESKDPQYILDIGSGTGVISLMLAQRFEKAHVHAVEIDDSAYIRSRENFLASKFSNRLEAYNCSFEQLDLATTYDLIVSNPPFYTNSLHNPDAKKKLARHADFNFFSTLLDYSFRKLSDRGTLQLILPTDLSKDVVLMGERIGFSLSRLIDVKSFEDSASIRQIIVLSKTMPVEPKLENFVIYKAKGEYTARYRQILSPFFLAY